MPDALRTRTATCSCRRVQLVPMEISPPGGKLFWSGWRPLWAQTVRNASGEEIEALGREIGTVPAEILERMKPLLEK